MNRPLSAAQLPHLAKYQLLDELGHGGMATVFRARDLRLDREVAIKIIHKHLRASPEVARRFAGEAKAVAKLRHPCIVEVYDVSEEDEHEKYLVVELLRGTTLRKLLAQHGPFPPEIAAGIGIDLGSALAHAHAAGVIHRDVKPENVLIDVAPEPGGPVRVKLTDFGIAKILDAQGVTSTGQVLGSPAHMAPEQIEGGRSTRARTSSPSACCCTSAWWGTCRSKAAILLRCCAGCSKAPTRPPTARMLWSVVAGPGCWPAHCRRRPRVATRPRRWSKP